MSARLAAAWTGPAVLAALSAFMLVQLSVRADRAAPPPLVDDLVVARGPTSVTVAADGSLKPSALTSGWSDPESGSGVWSLGHRAVLDLPVPATGKVSGVALTLIPFLPPGLAAEHVTARVDGRVLGDWRLTEPRPQTLRLAPATPIASPGRPLHLELELPDADQPARRVPGSPDARLIAVKLQRIEIEG